ncbi:MAG: hypothetical protein EHM41_00085 [Chloroflexi bacterium]|nr:MAG: hypothetical protein EHM41_00085 [Chloroflexota bacterium]
MKIAFSAYIETAKLIVFGALLLFGIIFGLRTYHWIESKFDNAEEQTRLEIAAAREEYRITINQLRAETKVVSDKSELNALLKDNAEMRKLIAANHEEIKNVGTITGSVNENRSLVLGDASDHTFRPGTGDPEEQYFKKIYASETDKEGKTISIPWAWSITYPNKDESERWKTGIYPIEYKTKIVQTEQADGQWNTYVEAWAENNKDSDSKGIKLPLKVDAEFVQLKKSTKEFYWWDPRLSLDLDATQHLVGAGLSLSLSGYGRTHSDLDFKFVEFGIIRSNTDYIFKFSPGAYNIGKSLPIIDNLYIGPFVGYNRPDLVYGLSLSVPF